MHAQHEATGTQKEPGAVLMTVQRSVAWLHPFRRLKIRYERCADVHEAPLSLVCIKFVGCP
jgi:hypothetical protein